MDQVKIGKFIAECRKKNNLTQMQLAEKLNITDRAISKWENGKSMPDSGIMLDLCNELKISVNELLSGEMIEMNNYNENLEKNLLEMIKQKELADRRLLTMEIVIGVLATTILLILTVITSFIEMADWTRILLITVGIILFIIGVLCAIKIEQVAGYYECQECHYKYIPTYRNTLFSMHFNRTRYMRCPKCNKKSWTKKVISK
ncbi:MAG: helix-turn-helix transcriptional regulator [Clostridia bacterium]|nr:helix-turn-helix transcriptional regulator [Clostridia bacterium]